MKDTSVWYHFRNLPWFPYSLKKVYDDAPDEILDEDVPQHWRWIKNDDLPTKFAYLWQIGFRGLYHMFRQTKLSARLFGPWEYDAPKEAGISKALDVRSEEEVSRFYAARVQAEMEKWERGSREAAEAEAEFRRSVGR